MTRAVRAAAALVRGWTKAYTVAVPLANRATRRDELTADLHDHLADLADRGIDGRRAAREILRRWARGIPADLSWALRPSLHSNKEETMNDRIRRLALSGWACALVLGALLLLAAQAGLQDGWREVGQHWWSALAVVCVLLAAVGLAVTLATVLRHRTGGRDHRAGPNLSQ